MKKIIIPIALLFLVVVGFFVVKYYRFGHTVTVLATAEHEDNLQDSYVQNKLNANKLAVKSLIQKSQEIVDNGPQGSDVVILNSEIVATKYAAKHPGKYKSIERYGHTALVALVWRKYFDVLNKAKKIETVKISNDETLYFAKTKDLVEMQLNEVTWQSLDSAGQGQVNNLVPKNGGNANSNSNTLPSTTNTPNGSLSGAVRLNFGEPKSSNGGLMTMLLVGSVLSPNQLLTPEVLASEGFLAKLNLFRSKSGNLEGNTEKMFQKALFGSSGSSPITIAYEDQLIAFAAKYPNDFAKIRDSIVVVYLDPTIPADQQIVINTDAGKEFYELVMSDDMRQLGWKNHGLRFSPNAVEDPKMVSVPHVASELQRIIKIPVVEVWEPVRTGQR